MNQRDLLTRNLFKFQLLAFKLKLLRLCLLGLQGLYPRVLYRDKFESRLSWINRLFIIYFFNGIHGCKRTPFEYTSTVYNNSGIMYYVDD
jgi:hypothetical protein